IGGTLMLAPSVFAACGDDDATSPKPNPNQAQLDLSTDIGIFNYAYALEQLEAAFYGAVVGAANFATLFTDANERELLTDIRNHEVAHREFLRAALGASAIPDLALNATTVSALIADRATILKNAQTFEDLGVAAYNGAGKQLKDARNLLVAGKIVSVEARHAAAIRDARDTTGRLFAGDDVVNANGLDVKMEPAAVLARVTALNLVTTPISVTKAPSDAATTDQAAPAAS
ncbi:MAG TPA: ferritin-like domain-containing protein, partial [Gemmatimonadaceae bacterium]|nr:ferritin-like domain-containing protein [Gemmatimonadaceae bacterium]